MFAFVILCLYCSKTWIIFISFYQINEGITQGSILVPLSFISKQYLSTVFMRRPKSTMSISYWQGLLLKMFKNTFMRQSLHGICSQLKKKMERCHYHLLKTGKVPMVHWVCRPSLHTVLVDIVCVSLCSSLHMYQRRRIKLRDNMMKEDCEVSWPRLQQVYTLETATLSVNLTEGDRMINFLESQTHNKPVSSVMNVIIC